MIMSVIRELRAGSALNLLCTKRTKIQLLLTVNKQNLTILCYDSLGYDRAKLGELLLLLVSHNDNSAILFRMAPLTGGWEGTSHLHC